MQNDNRVHRLMWELVILLTEIDTKYDHRYKVI